MHVRCIVVGQGDEMSLECFLGYYVGNVSQEISDIEQVCVKCFEKAFFSKLPSPDSFVVCNNNIQTTLTHLRDEEK